MVIFRYQLMLFFKRQFFYLSFTFQRILFGCQLLAVDKGDRPAAACIFGAFAAVVHIQAVFNIGGPSGVERTVGTFDYVNIIHIIINP